jgi:glycosyltransferase involved in cell wall biosynthesis
MPVFNESEIIQEVVRDFLQDQSKHKLELVIVDDKSTDETYKRIVEVSHEFPGRIHIFQNEQNLGHGPSFTRALKIGLEMNPDLIVSCDGDGPIAGSDLFKLFDIKPDYDILEISRQKRVEPLFRKVTTQATRMLVFVKSKRIPVDANTPIRVYMPQILNQILPKVDGTKVPNLLISIISRNRRFNLMSTQVTVFERKLNQPGTMWGQGLKPRRLPNSRFIKFSFSALMEVLRFNEK